MDYIVSGVNGGRMVTSFGRPRARRNSQPLKGEVVEVAREGRDQEDNARNRGGYTLFGYAGAERGFDDKAGITLKVRTNQDLSDLVGKRVVLTLVE